MTTCLSVIEYPNRELLDDAVVSPETPDSLVIMAGVAQ